MCFKQLLYISLSFVFLQKNFAQKISFVASSEAEKTAANQYRTYLGDYIEVTFTVLNGVGQGFVAPNFADFSVKSGPNAFSMEQINNGVRTSKYGYGFVLQPKRVGIFTIGAAKLKIQGTEYSTQPIQIEVVKDETKTPKGKQQPVALRIKTDKKEYFVGEQINLSYQILTNVGIQDYEITNRPQFKDFLVQDLQLAESQTSTTRQNGISYKTFELEKKVLYATKSGNFTLDPIAANLAIPTKEKMNGFSIPSSEVIAAESDPITLTIKDLPTTQNPDFSGAVGVWEMSVEANRNELNTGETLLLTATFSGKGDPKRLIPPRLKSNDSLEIYDPKVIEEGISLDANNEPVSIKKVEYLIVPKYAGNHQVQPILNYFDTESQDYVNIKTAPFAFTAIGTAVTNITQPTTPTIENDSKFSWKKTFGYGIMFVGALLLLVLLFYFWKNKSSRTIANHSKPQQTTANHRKPSQITQTISNHSEPQQTTANIWSEIEAMKNSHNYDDFYKNIQKILSEQLSIRYKIPQNEISENNIVQKLSHTNLSENQLQDIAYILKTCTLARFGGVAKPEEVEVIYQKTKELL